MSLPDAHRLFIRFAMPLQRPDPSLLAPASTRDAGAGARGRLRHWWRGVSRRAAALRRALPPGSGAAGATQAQATLALGLALLAALAA